jgi:hypothetical protein
MDYSNSRIFLVVWGCRDILTPVRTAFIRVVVVYRDTPLPYFIFSFDELKARL